MKIIQCVPNFSEGKDLEKIEQIVSVFKNKPGFKLVSYEPDKDYNRTVVTLLGDPIAIKEAVVEMVGKTTELIDMNVQRGEHPRMGATDVIPFVPIRGIKMKECVKLANETAQLIWDQYQVPIFLYEDAATQESRVNLSDIRKGEFEGMISKIKDPLWKPDFGNAEVHLTAGVTAVGARAPLVAFNINLDTTNVKIADEIAKTIRHSSGGFRFIKAGSAELLEKGIVQVTMNITNFKKTSIYRVFETVKMEAKRYGVNICGSEIVGLVPLEAITESLAYYLGLTDFDVAKVLETHLLDK